MEFIRHPVPYEKIEILILYLNGTSKTRGVGDIEFSSQQIKVILSWLEMFVKVTYSKDDRERFFEAIDEALLYWLLREENINRATAS